MRDAEPPPADTTRDGGPAGSDGGTPPAEDDAGTGEPTDGGGGTTAADAICEVLVPEIAACAGRDDFDVATCRDTYARAVERGCPAENTDAFARFVRDGGSFSCMDVGFGERDLFPETGEERVVLGMFCPVTVSKASCAGLSCDFGSDCGGFPDTQDCNGVVGRCFDHDAYCPALPCSTGSECPGWPETQDCNGALGVCIFL